MDFFMLPKEILREIMVYVTIKDRLRLRLTSRAFSKLVAESNAGFYKDRCAMEAPRHDHNMRSCENAVSLNIGGAKFHCVPKTEEGFARILYLRNLLFSGICLDSFRFEASSEFSDLDDSIPFAFVRKLIRTVKIRNVHLIVNSGQQLEHALQLITGCKQSTFKMDLLFRPKMEKLLSIPPMTEMKIAMHNQSAWSLNSFFLLLAAQPNLTLAEPVDIAMTLPNLDLVVQLLYEIDRPRRVHFRARNETLRTNLGAHGIDALSEEGNCYGEASLQHFRMFIFTIKYYFEILFVSAQQDALHLRYRRCLIELKNIHWSNDHEYVDVYVTNCDAYIVDIL